MDGQIKKYGIGHHIATVFVILTALADLALIYLTPQNGWVIVFFIWFGGLIINIGNFIFAKRLCDVTSLHPFVLLILTLLVEAILVVGSVMMLAARNDGVFMMCADACNKSSFMEMFGSTFMLIQFGFAGFYLGYLFQLIASFVKKARS